MVNRFIWLNEDGVNDPLSYINKYIYNNYEEEEYKYSYSAAQLC